jgi:hypothetical protein
MFHTTVPPTVVDNKYSQDCCDNIMRDKQRIGEQSAMRVKMNPEDRPELEFKHCNPETIPGSNKEGQQ